MRFSEWVELREAKDACYHKVMRRYGGKHSAYASGAMVTCRKKGVENWGEGGMRESTFDLEKERGLRGWFDRNHGKGWIDCKASRKGHLVSCGRKKAGKGADRAYPACRPTLSACNPKGKRRKKSGKAVSWD